MTTRSRSRILDSGVTRETRDPVTQDSIVQGTSRDVGGGSTTYRIPHGLKQKNVVVQVRENTGSYRQVFPEIRLDSDNSIQLGFSSPPAINAYRVMISKPGYTQLLGGGAKQEFTIRHSLQSKALIAQVHETSGDHRVSMPTLRMGDAHTVVIRFNTPPESITYGCSLLVGAASQIIGDGIRAVYRITHNLNTRDLFVCVWENGGAQRLVLPQIRFDSVNSFLVTFASPASNQQYRVVWSEARNDSILPGLYVLLDGGNRLWMTGQHGNTQIDFTCRNLHPQNGFFFPPLATHPTPEQPGQAYYNTAARQVYFWDGTIWRPIGEPGE